MFESVLSKTGFGQYPSDMIQSDRNVASLFETILHLAPSERETCIDCTLHDIM